MDEKSSAIEVAALPEKANTIPPKDNDSPEDMFAFRRSIRTRLIDLIRSGGAPARTLPYPTDDAAESLATLLDSDTATIRTVVAHIRASGDHLDPAVPATPAAPRDDGFFYFIYNKPMGAVCARFNAAQNAAKAAKLAAKAAKFAKSGTIQKIVGAGFQSVFETLPPGYPPIPHVGRLDKETCGLIMFTDNSSLHQPLLNKLMAKELGAPCISKLYDVDLNASKTMYHKFGCFNLNHVLESMSQPLDYVDTSGKGEPVLKFRTDAAKVHVVTDLGAWPLSPGAQIRIRVEISEGRNRQVRRLCKRAGAFVVRLMRQNFGEIELGDLKIGEARSLTLPEVQTMFDMFVPHYPVLVKRKEWERERMEGDGDGRRICYTDAEGNVQKKLKLADETGTETSMTTNQYQNEQSDQEGSTTAGHVSTSDTAAGDKQNAEDQVSASASSSSSAEVKLAEPFQVKIATLPHPAWM